MTLLESAVAGGPGLGVALVQVTLVALLGLLAWLAARRGGPALRGAILLASLVGLLVVPGLAAVAPVWLPLPELRIADCGLRFDQFWDQQPVISSPQPLPPPDARPALAAALA